MFVTMAPWQILLWIAGVELISIPLIVFTTNAIFIGYFKLKEQHFVKMLNSVTTVLNAMIDAATNKLREEKNNDN